MTNGSDDFSDVALDAYEVSLVSGAHLADAKEQASLHGGSIVVHALPLTRAHSFFLRNRLEI